MPMKTVSFVIPVYNPPEERFRALLESVLSQEGVAVEVVAVNDGSTNNSLEILREFEVANPGKMIVVDQKNAGEGPSRNEGFRHATGDYVWFVDCDALVRPGAAAYLVDAIDRTDADQIMFNAVTCTPLDDKPFPEEWTGVVQPTTALAEIARHRIGAWYRMSRRSFLARVGVRYCNAKTGADGPESLRWALEAHSLVQVEDPCYKYIMAPGSSSQAPADVRLFTTGWQIMDIYGDLRERFPRYATWIDLWNFTRARGHLAMAESYLSELDIHSPNDIETVRRARDEYLRRFDTLDSGNPLIALYDFARAVGRRDLRPRLLETVKKAASLRGEVAQLKRERAQLKREGAQLKREADRLKGEVESLRKSLSWRITAPLRAILRPFVRGR